KCTVFISHRLGSARLADRIVVLKDGRIVETGTHDELIRRNGEYARMFRLQAGWYREDGVMTG
ncbi:MAG: ABC transporter ATP-binding protein, partial [Firmicutes bacterium]|nr:ABC transporter ATP-binding protein [Bacillota bacterium]